MIQRQIGGSKKTENDHAVHSSGQAAYRIVETDATGIADQGGDPFHGRHANPADAEVEQHPAEYAAADAHRGQRPQRVPDLPLPAIRQSGGGSQADGSSQRQSRLPRGTTAGDEGRLDMTRRDEAEDVGQKGDDEVGDGRRRQPVGQRTTGPPQQPDQQAGRGAQYGRRLPDKKPAIVARCAPGKGVKQGRRHT